MSESYTIKSGESLSAIAARNGISVSELMAANPGIENANSVQAGQKITIPLVDSSAISKPEDSFVATTKNKKSITSSEKEPWQNLEALIKNGKDDDAEGAKITADKGFLGIKTGDYTYTSDGTLTYGELKEQLGLADGIIRKRNESTILGVGSNPDEKVIKEGITLKFKESDLPKKPLKDKDGNEVDGFSKSLLSNTIYYTVQSGDTKEGIYEKFSENKKALKGYKTADALYGYSEFTLQVGTQVALPKKFLGIF